MFDFPIFLGVRSPKTQQITNTVCSKYILFGRVMQNIGNKQKISSAFFFQFLSCILPGQKADKWHLYFSFKTLMFFHNLEHFERVECCQDIVKVEVSFVSENILKNIFIYSQSTQKFGRYQLLIQQQYFDSSQGRWYLGLGSTS